MNSCERAISFPCREIGGDLRLAHALQTLIHLVEERRKNWRTLQYLSGFDVTKLDAAHHAELDALQRQYKESVEARESSIDSIARPISAAPTRFAAVRIVSPSGMRSRLFRPS